MKENIEKMIDSIVQELEQEKIQVTRTSILHKITGYTIRKIGRFSSIKQHDISAYCQKHNILT